MDLLLKDKVFIITEGTRIGNSLVTTLAAENAIPVIIGGNKKDYLKGIEDLNSKGKRAYYIEADLTKPEECEKAINEIIKKYGHINGLVNNSKGNVGVGLEKGNYIKFMESMHKNLVHYFLIAHFALPELKKTQGPILNISSKPAGTDLGNTTTSGGLNALTREWAVELLKYNIRVNAIEINSGISIRDLTSSTEEIANMAIFLLSELSSHTTGQIIQVNMEDVPHDRILENG